jgi:putative transposase
MIESNEKLSQTRQCLLLSLARSTFYYQPQSLDNEKLALLRKLDEQYLKMLQYGARSYATWFVRQGIGIGRKRTANMMKILGIVSTAPKPKSAELMFIQHTECRFCIQVLEAAIQDYGCPEIFNTDQGAQFTAEAWICILKNHGIQISMDGKGRYHDNIFIERLWRTVKYEFLYTRAFSSLKEVRQNLTQWFD